MVTNMNNEPTSSDTVDRLNDIVFFPRIHHRVDGGWCSIIESAGCLSFTQMRRRRFTTACFPKILVAVGLFSMAMPKPNLKCISNILCSFMPPDCFRTEFQIQSNTSDRRISFHLGFNEHERKSRRHKYQARARI